MGSLRYQTLLLPSQNGEDMQLEVGGVGAIVDGTNGASNRLHPRPLIVRLAPLNSSEGAVLLDKDGKLMKSVKDHNDTVRADVAKTLGSKLAGMDTSEPQ